LRRFPLVVERDTVLDDTATPVAKLFQAASAVCVFGYRLSHVISVRKPQRRRCLNWPVIDGEENNPSAIQRD